MTSSAVSADRMGGKQEPTQTNQPGKMVQMATQEQLRLARLTQEASKDEDQASIQKAIRKVIEATRCSQSVAEIALYDADNDVGTAIMAVLDQPPTDDWQEQKSRKAKKQSSDYHDEEDNRDAQRSDRRHGRSGSSAATRNGNEAPRFRSRGAANKVGGGRGGRDGDDDAPQSARRDDDMRNSRGRGGRGGVLERGRGRGRGRLTTNKGVGGAPSLATIGTWDGGAGNTWDNSMAKQHNDKDNMMWQNSMAGVHKQPVVNGGDEWSGTGDDTLNGEDTDWKNVGTLVFQRKEETEAAASTPSFASVARLSKPTEQSPPSSMQPPPQRTPSVGDSQSITGSATPQQQQQSAYGVRNNNAIVTSLLNQQPTSETFRPQVASSPPRNPGNATSWTQQLKNDLGIGRVPVSSAPVQGGASRQSTVEFVSDNGRDDSSTLPEYQFGFHVEAPSVTPQQQHDYSASNSVDAVLFPTRTSKNDAVLDGVRGPTNYSQTSTAVNGSMSKDGSKTGAASIQSSYGSMPMPSAASVNSAPKGMSIGQSTASLAPALAYAETTTMSYPDASRSVYAMNQQFAMSPAATSTYSQTSNKTVTTAATASKAPVANPMFNTNVQQMYNPTFPYMNLYSPVTTVRPDDPQSQYAAALMTQYPFMGQIDLSSMSSMLPPVVASGAQQQSRNDQSNNYADVLGDYNKAYTAGRDPVTSASSNVAPPPGFSGPPSNVAAAAAAQAAFGIPQANFTSLFQNTMLPPTYHHQMPLSYMLPNMTGNGQNPVNLQQKLNQQQQQMFTQSTFDDPNQTNQQQDYGRSAQSGAMQSFGQQQQQGNKGGSTGYGGSASVNDNKSVYGGGSHGQLGKGTFERSNYTTTATATPPPNQMSGLNQYAQVAFNPNAHMTGFPTNAGYGNAQLQQLSPMAMPGAHMHDGRSSGQQSGVKHGGAMQQNKYAGQTGSYGGGWA